MEQFKISLLALVMSAIMGTAPALAQGAYVGAQIGYHDIDTGLDEDDQALVGDDFGINGVLYGLYGGYDFEINDDFIAGVEVNFNLATSDLDSDYGVAARVGYKASDSTLLFARGGYQEVNLDALNVAVEVAEAINGGPISDAERDALEAGIDDVDDSDGGFLIGIGGEFMLQDNLALRVAFDTIEFDSTRLTAGFAFKF
ncbi:MAG: outer membrane beta-barrel protein [Pseudomonadota bacterium]